MTYLKQIYASLNLPADALERSILFLVSILLSIWLMRDTIALRNILLVTCSLLSIFYLCKNFKELFVYRKIPIKNWLSLIFLVLLFVWVVIHLIFLSHEPVKQLQELTSTWLRSLLAIFLGFTAGLIVSRHEKCFILIMFSLIFGFILLFCHYIGLVLQSGNIFQLMLWNSFYWGKANEVLLGVLYITGFLGLIDGSILRSAENDQTVAQEIGPFELAIYAVGFVLVLHCFVFEIDTRNGIGISVILGALFLVKAILKLMFWKKSSRLKEGFKPLVLALFLLICLSYFGYKQLQTNPGWHSYIEDVQFAIQVDRYNNWQKTPVDEVLTPSGRQIAGNTYERTAWFLVAIRTVPKYPWGYGLLHNSFGRLVKFDYPASDLTSSHNGWLDFALSFGLVGITLVLSSLLWSLMLSIQSDRKLSPVVFWSLLGILLCYALAELMVYHGVEYLMFWLAFLPISILSHNRGPINHGSIVSG